jgi:hypothetical protein
MKPPYPSTGRKVLNELPPSKPQQLAEEPHRKRGGACQSVLGLTIERRSVKEPDQAGSIACVGRRDHWCSEKGAVKAVGAVKIIVDRIEGNGCNESIWFSESSRYSWSSRTSTGVRARFEDNHQRQVSWPATRNDESDAHEKIDYTRLHQSPNSHRPYRQPHLACHGRHVYSVW